MYNLGKDLLKINTKEEAFIVPATNNRIEDAINSSGDAISRKWWINFKLGLIHQHVLSYNPKF